MNSFTEEDPEARATEVAAEHAAMARLVADKMLYPWRFWSPQYKRAVSCIILLSVLSMIIMLIMKTNLV